MYWVMIYIYWSLARRCDLRRVLMILYPRKLHHDFYLPRSCKDWLIRDWFYVFLSTHNGLFRVSLIQFIQYRVYRVLIVLYSRVYSHIFLWGSSGHAKLYCVLLVYLILPDYAVCYMRPHFSLNLNYSFLKRLGIIAIVAADSIIDLISAHTVLNLMYWYC